MGSDRSVTYSTLKQAVESEPLPAVVVDLATLDRNTERLGRIVSDADKNLRVASKSVRVPAILKRIRDQLGDTFGGLMTFSPSETVFLHEMGFNDFLLAYPRVHTDHIKTLLELNRTDASVTVMVDEPEHLEQIKTAADVSGTEEPLPVCIDLDVSYRPMDHTHIGVRRSPVLDIRDFKQLYRSVKDCPAVRFKGVMGYEAQQAGVPDDSPYHPVKNYAIRAMKVLSRRSVRKKRKEIATFLEEIEPDHLFNAGGTGSLRASVQEDWITEVTAGSGFLQSHLFDYYRNHHNEPAFCFGLPVTRKPADNIVTCQSGGFTASGPVDDDKAPRPFRPEAMHTLPAEGFGEVQTPLKLSDELRLEVGDPLFFRPAKAGEIAERFNEYLLVRDGTV
ncbi:MAG: alanine racemase, partial [bacterium]